MKFCLEDFVRTGKNLVWFLRINVPTQLKGKGFQNGHSSNSSCSSLKPGKTRQWKSAQISQEQYVQEKQNELTMWGQTFKF